MGCPCGWCVYTVCKWNWCPEGDKLKHKVHLQYQTTNNEVEYKALLKGLELSKSVEVKSILVLGDS